MSEYTLRSARYIAREYMEKILQDGSTAVDATMGNGHDTETLARLVGEKGRVFAFDVQEAAVRATRERLDAAGLLGRVTLFQESHAKMAELVPEAPDLVVFNLGWLPGGDKTVTTLLSSTEEAVRQALSLIRPGGMALICCYPGHPEGKQELAFLEDLFASLQPQQFNCLEHTFINAGQDAPRCFAVQKQSSSHNS